MAIVEFKNIQTQKVFFEALNREDLELAKIRRGLKLLRSGLWFPFWETV